MQRLVVEIVLLLVLSASALPGRAQDIGGLLRSLTSQVTGVRDAATALRSITEVTLGTVLPGAEMPVDPQGRVLLYRAPWCGFCKRAAAHMQQRGIAFLERDIESDPAIKAEYTRYGGTRGVPLIVFGQKTMMGFAPADFDRAYADFQQTGAAAAPVAAATARDTVGTLDTIAPSGAALRPTTIPEARAALQAGDALTGKINGVPVYAQPSKSERVLARLGKADEAVYMGEERHGFYRVTAPSGEGWVDKLLVRKP